MAQFEGWRSLKYLSNNLDITDILEADLGKKCFDILINSYIFREKIAPNYKVNPFSGGKYPTYSISVESK